MGRSQLELLVLYQDLNMMLREAENEDNTMGFPVKGKDNLEKAKTDLEKKLKPRYLNDYRRLQTRYKYPVVPVQDDTCLGCCAKLPTSYGAEGRTDQRIFTCENCGRMLFWL